MEERFDLLESTNIVTNALQEIRTVNAMFDIDPSYAVDTYLSASNTIFMEYAKLAEYTNKLELMLVLLSESGNDSN